MLDVHPPHHAPNTWRDFFIHIATIVIGLLIAVGLEQTVEFFHHRHQVNDTREALRDEREKNKRIVEMATAYFRLQVLSYQNNFLVLSYLKQHPGTPEDKLPGVMLWGTGSSHPVSSAWQTALQTGITALMPRNEVLENERFYDAMHGLDATDNDLWNVFNDATRYRLTDPDVTHLSPAQLDVELDRVQNMIGANYKVGLCLKEINRTYPDFPTPTEEEVFALREPGRTDADKASLAAARAISGARIAKARATVDELRKTNPDVQH